jgi:hypothetical protein
MGFVFSKLVFHLYPSKGVWAETADPLGHFRGQFCKPARHGGRKVHHADPFRFDPDGGEDLPGVVNAFLGFSISFQEMAFPFQSAGHENPIHAAFNGF